jgi:hypothetical protein
MGVKRRRKEKEEKLAGIFQNVLAQNVRDVIELYSSLWGKRYGGRPVVTGKERSKLADLLTQVQDVCAVKNAVRHYFEDDAPERAGHSMAWFVGAYNEHAAASAAGGNKRGSKAKACKERDEFEDEVERYRKGCDAPEGEQPRGKGARRKVRRRGR